MKFFRKMSNHHEDTQLLEQGFATVRTAEGAIRRADDDASMMPLVGAGARPALVQRRGIAPKECNDDDEPLFRSSAGARRTPVVSSASARFEVPFSDGDEEEEDGDGPMDLDKILEDVFEEIDRLAEEPPKLEPTPQLLLRNELIEKIQPVADLCQSVATSLGNVMTQIGFMPLRHMDRGVLLLTRSEFFDALAYEMGHALSELHAWSKEHNKKVEMMVLANARRGPEPSVLRR